MVVIKKVSDALKNNDTISNSDGHTTGTTQPGGEAQARLIEETYTKAGLGPARTIYFEAHAMSILTDVRTDTYP